jgi:predicted nucleotidyltransferase
MPSRSSTSVRIFYPRRNREELIRELKDRLPALTVELPLLRVLLFGSYASGRFTTASDIDLLVVYRGPHREDAYALVRKVLQVPRLEPHVYSFDEYAAARATVQRMERDGVVLLDLLNT